MSRTVVGGERRRPILLLTIVLAMIATLLAAGVDTATAAPPDRPGVTPPGRATDATLGELTVRGSVEQIHVIHAEAGVQVDVRGPRGYRTTATTDDNGGLVLREVPPGNGYTVTVEGERDRFPVRVLSPEDHPDPRFYSAQELDPSEGYLQTRDGTLLAYQVVLPDPDVFGPGPYPVVVDYSAYRPSIDFFDGVGRRFPELGYAAIGVNMRGSACSGGAFDYFEQLQWLDGYDLVEAFAAQPWSDGVALIGKSYPGISQLFVASTQPPSLNAIVPGHVIGDFYRDVAYPGGILNFAFAGAFSVGQDERSAFPSSYDQVNERAEVDPICLANQALRGQNVSMAEGIFGNPYDGAYWQTRAPERLVGDIVVPTLIVNAWQDEQTGAGPAKLLERFPDSTPARLLGTNGDHGEYFRGDVWAEVVRFLDVYLGGQDPAQVAAYEAEDPVTILLELDRYGNAGASFGLSSFETAAGDGQRWMLGEDLLADTADDGGDSSTFTYDPPGLFDFGRGWLMPGQNEWLPPLQDRVTFTSDPLQDDLVIAGSGSVDLWIAADATDVDLEVTLTEIRPDGQEQLVQSGWLRASHRALNDQLATALRPRHLHTAAAQEPLTVAASTPVRVELFPVAHAFREGSEVRLIVDGPGGNRWRWGFDPLPGGFDVTVAHSDEHPSSLVLPVLDVPLELPPLPPCGTVSSQPCR
ncbi:MAG: CocE/NonD family hydrolase [Nitriliruptor sp.]|nr:MAG: CocE/NonD family hydrolase [Nitriliruptor sp.]